MAEGNGRAEGLIHNRFEDRVQEISTALEASDDDLSTQAYGGTIENLDNMENFHDAKLEYPLDPYGYISSTYYWVRDTEYDDEKTLHGFHSPMTIEPGYITWDSHWHNNAAWNRHYWDRNDMSWQDVGNGYWKPAGPSEGGTSTTTVSVSVSAGWMTAEVSAGMSWSFSEPATERTDLSSEYNDYCAWEWDVNDKCGGSVRHSTLSMQPSSTCEMTDYDCSMGERDIADVEVEGDFTDGNCSDTHWLKSSTTFFIQC
ncbi:hypothetical protein [Halorussus caseinilyticus]|uniref:Uncharacterized protein n=1 Tax=Halorussus caseinilyticus TaxID=3034025 RepID=A0ABD5WLQ1_9EURY